ncbi:MAG TPA: porin family protein [Anseongella sp.]|nr:porin family protein [Anseongella sp.]
MKKNYLLLFLLSFACLGYARAQTTDRVLRFGIKAGLNLADFNDPDHILSNQDKSTLTGLHAGGFMTISIGKKFSVQPEAVISMQGAKYDDPILIDPESGQMMDAETTKDEFIYLNIPVMLQFSPAGAFRLEAGPQLGILLTAHGKVENAGQSFRQDQKQYFESLDFGIGLGLGYRLPLGLDFYGRYNLGLVNVFNKDAIGNSHAYISNSVIGIGVGYVF